MSVQSSIPKKLKELVCIEYDVLQAVRTAKASCRRRSDKIRTERIERTHEQHIRSLAPAVAHVGEQVPRVGDWRQVFMEGRVVAAAMWSDDWVLRAVKANELEVVRAYRRVLGELNVHEGIRIRLHEHVMNSTRNGAWLGRVVAKRAG